MAETVRTGYSTRKKLLVVEDEKYLQKQLQAMLVEHGYEVAAPFQHGDGLWEFNAMPTAVRYGDQKR